ncbi:MAG: glycosyltransferase family 4 protein [Actinobacteria bacterium]|nr:glycosyltransferase family 4 protein [Actinomycetota bacterium]
MARQNRVAMLVDTAVAGDARVVKTAQFISEQGYDVLALGVQTDPTTPTEGIGDFRVALVDVADWELGSRPVPGRLSYRTRGEARGRRRELARRRRTLTDRRAPDRQDRRLRTLARRSSLLLDERIHGVRQRLTERNDEALFRRARNWLGQPPQRRAETLSRGEALWPQLDPNLLEYEKAMAPVLADFDPGIIHAHDYVALGVAVRHARRQPYEVRVIYDAHEYVPGLQGRTPTHLGRCVYEATHIGSADAVLTVSQPLAELLVRTHGLMATPEVVLNCPEARALRTHPEFDRDVRSDCALAPEVPLLVYSGAISLRRGLDTAIAGLAHLPDVHLAVIAPPQPEARQFLLEAAEESGVGERLHVIDYVPRQVIVQHLRTASAAVHPMVHLPNHEIALPNKFFDYAHAGLPMVVSDVEYLSSVVSELGLGEAFVAGSSEDFASAVRRVLAGEQEFRAALTRADLDRWTWESQTDTIMGVYQDLGIRQGSAEED